MLKYCLPEHCLANWYSWPYLHDGNILIAILSQVATLKFDEPTDKCFLYDTKFLFLYTWGLRWKTWFETAKLCSSLNGGRSIPSRTGNVNLSSSSKKYLIVKFIRINFWLNKKLYWLVCCRLQSVRCSKECILQFDYEIM